MKKLLSIFTLGITMMFAHTAMAQDGYFGVNVSSANSADIDTAGINLGVVGGLNMSNNFALELNVDTSVTDAKAGAFDVNIQTLAGYGVFRSNGDTYFKAKAGFHSTTSKTSVSSVTDDGLTYGIGVGFGEKYEVEYTIFKAKDGTGNADLNKISFTVLF